MWAEYYTSVKTIPAMGLDDSGWTHDFKSRFAIDPELEPFSDEMQRHIADMIVDDIMPGWYVMNSMFIKTSGKGVLVIQANHPNIDGHTRILISVRMT